ncbi:hypothetical protein FD755_015141 [Muntiacus reevesi]|uniref:KH type-2 domain-containing protein n=1 Tax=Muntiacus reevesi TaxID=9886 RepID=A0A5N3XIL0_MUNRE|nr:hypothetical protein FD755_015141 [Muntiacus reevesi]
MAVQISKKRKFVFEEDGIFKAELNKFLTQEMAEDGYSGVEVRVTPTRTEIITIATRTENALGEEGWRIWELTVVVQKRSTGSLCAMVQAESLHYRLQEALLCEGPTARAKSMKFVDGLMIHSGAPVNYYADGVLGIKVKIMLPWDPTGKTGPKKPLLDHGNTAEPRDENAAYPMNREVGSQSCLPCPSR